MARAKTVALDGVALLDKPEGLTANAALQRVRRALGAAKAGHTGTLDPMATGLMLLAFGEATKFAQRWLEADKVYLTRVRFGVATSTGDAEGEVIARAPVSFGAGAVQEVLPRFLGTIEQVPPMVSALKHEGKPLYRYAREGVTIERAPRPVTIHELRLMEWDEALAAATLYARVGKGTYIRTLAEDLGAALGVPAHIDRLRRLAIGPFSVEKARTLAEWEEAGAQGREWLLPPDALVADLPRVELDATRTLAFLAGQRIARAALGDSRSSGMVRVYGAREEGIPIFIGLGECDPARGLSPKRVIANITPPSSRVPVIPAE